MICPLAGPPPAFLVYNDSKLTSPTMASPAALLSNDFSTSNVYKRHIEEQRVYANKLALDVFMMNFDAVAAYKFLTEGGYQNLNEAFAWGDSPQGELFWRGIAEGVYHMDDTARTFLLECIAYKWAENFVHVD